MSSQTFRGNFPDFGVFRLFTTSCHAVLNTIYGVSTCHFQSLFTASPNAVFSVRPETLRRDLFLVGKLPKVFKIHWTSPRSVRNHLETLYKLQIRSKHLISKDVTGFKWVFGLLIGFWIQLRKRSDLSNLLDSKVYINPNP